MSYTIRKSTLVDLPTILSLRDQAREIMRSYGNTFQWPDGYLIVLPILNIVD